MFFAAFVLFTLSAVPVLAKDIIIDTDFLSFTDDPGALAVANALQKQDQANIIGVSSTVNSTYAIPAIDAINTYYRNYDISYAQNRAITNETFEPNITLPVPPEYITTLANSTRFHQFIQDGSDPSIEAPLDFYRSILEAAENKSVTIISIGFFDNLNALYHCDGGKELIASKVAELVVQGGDFGPRRNASSPNPIGYNLAIHFETSQVLADWPSPVTYLGSNVGRLVKTGAALDQTPEENPVRVAFDIYNKGKSVDGGSHDLVATYYAIVGLSGIGGNLRYGNSGGRIEIYPNKTAAWNNDAKVPAGAEQHYLEFTSTGNETQIALAKSITQLLTLDPNAE